jgi:hypothetical protein
MTNFITQVVPSFINTSAYKVLNTPFWTTQGR